MGNFQRKAGTTFDFVQDYANQPIIMNSSEPVSSLPDPTMLEISGALLAPDGTGLMQTQNSQNELSSVLSQLGLPESYVTNQLNSNSAGLSYLQSLNPEILGVIQNPSDEAIRAEFVDSHYDGEMKETDKLNPAKLSAQCNSYTEKLNQENLSLDALYTAFHNASAVDLEGKTAGAFLEQCENYCIIIECLQMANYCDIEDNTKLYNKLGYIYLDGEVIIPGRIEAIENWNECIDKRNTCNYLAGITDDDDDRDRLHSEAGYWQRMADSYYAEWERLTKLKEEFEDVNAFSKGLYTGNAEQFRSFAYQGMQLVGYAFKAGEYTMQSGVDEWKKSALQLKQDCLVNITNQWKTADGDWDMDKLGATISLEADQLTQLEYMALCYVVDDLSDEEMAVFIDSAYKETNRYEALPLDYNSGGMYSSAKVQYSASSAFMTLADMYIQTNCAQTGCTDEYKLYKANVLYIFSEVTPDLYIHIDKDDENYEKELGIDISYDNLNHYGVVEISADSSMGAPTHSQEYKINLYTENLTGPINTTIKDDLQVENLSQQYCVAGVQIIQGAIPGVNHFSTAVSLIQTYTDHVESVKKVEKESDWLNLSEALQDLKISATVINRRDEGDYCFYLTNVNYNDDYINEQIDAWNNTHPEETISCSPTDLVLSVLGKSDAVDQETVRLFVEYIQ